MPVLSDRVGTFTDSVIRRMTRINNQYDSINLSQGFPDFDPPKQLMDALAETAYKGPHQYAVTFGAQNFREALAKKTSPALHHEVDPNTEIYTLSLHDALPILLMRVMRRMTESVKVPTRSLKTGMRSPLFSP